MTLPPGTQVRPVAETAKHGVRFLPPARYRHPGDVIRLIIAGQNPRLVAGRWLRADGLIRPGGGLH
jgi:hypothetical protein